MTSPRPGKDRPTGPFDLSKSPIHLDSRAGGHHAAVPLAGFGFDGPSFEDYIAKHCAPGAPGRLVMVEASPVSWPVWECHGEGDELVIILEGKGVMIQEIDGQPRRTPIGPGSTIINPAGVWHTADIEEPIKAIYITPCPGTQHRPR
jgi:mannose-6-phosphate isomerase-like protein (cupin superfamily)